MLIITGKRKNHMKLQQVLSVTRKAVDEFQMIQKRDKIAVGVSGGKDSLTLLYALNGLSRFYPNPFSIEAITVDLGFEGVSMDPIQALCQELHIPYTVCLPISIRLFFRTEKKAIPALSVQRCARVHSTRKPRNWLQQNCLCHHKDDVIETMLMSLIFEGRFHTFSRVTYWDRMDLTLIRPMLYMEEIDVIVFRTNITFL